MPEILSFGQYGTEPSVFKLVWMEIADLSLFAKLTIVILILFPLVVILSSGVTFQLHNYASPQTPDVSNALPPNCHLAVDFTECHNESSCQPQPKIICDAQK